MYGKVYYVQVKQFGLWWDFCDQGGNRVYDYDLDKASKIVDNLAIETKVVYGPYPP